MSNVRDNQDSKPAVRFKGFSDAWEKRKLGEITDSFDGKRVPIEAAMRKKGPYPYYGATGVIDHVNDYIFDGEYVLLAEDGANIILRSSPIAYLTSGKFWLNNHAHIFTAKNGSNVFLLNLFEMKNYSRYNTGTAQPKLNANVLKNIRFNVPSFQEQSAIGEFMNALNSTIALHQRKVENLQKLKKSLLQQMFVSGNDQVPKIRFKGFADAWEQRKAKSIFKTVSEKGHPDLPVLSASQEDGMILRSKSGIDIQYKASSLSSYKLVRPNQFVIHLRSFQGGFAYSRLTGIASPAYTVLDFQNLRAQNPKYWIEVLRSPLFIERLKTVTYGIRDGRSISFSDFGTLKFRFPIISEQQKIAGFFAKLDLTIALHQRKVENLQKLKKSLLRLMFI